MNFDKLSLLYSLTWDADWVSAVSFIGPNRIAAGNLRGEILQWDLPENPEKRPELSPEAAKIPTTTVSADQKPLYVSPPPARQLTGHTNGINRLLCVEDRWLISASNDHTIRYWDATAAPDAATAKVVLNASLIEETERNKGSGRKPPPPMEVEVKTQPSAKTIEGAEWIVGLGLSEDRSTLIAGDDAGNVVLYDRAAAMEKKRWQVTGWAYAVAISPDHKQALVSERKPLVFDQDRHTGINLWDVEKGAVQHDLGKEFKDMQIAGAAYSPDGKALAIGRGGEVNGNEGKIFIIDPATGKKVREFTPGHQYGVTDLCFHPDGQHLLSSGRDTLVRVWNVADGKLVKEIGKPRGGQFKDWIHAISVSPDGRRVAAADMAGLVHVWEFGA